MDYTTDSGVCVSANVDELHATITARAELDRQFMRQLVETTTAALAKSLSGFLDRIDQYDQSRAREHQDLKALLGEAGARVETLERRVELTEADISAILGRLDRLEAPSDGGQR